MDFKNSLFGDTLDFPEAKGQPIVNKAGKSVIIWQPFGLGDCIFSQGIAHHYIDGGYKVYWPVVRHYLMDLQRAYPDVYWLDENMYLSPDRHNVAQVKYDLLHSLMAPIHRSMEFEGVRYDRVMRAKYDMYGLDWTKWREHALWKRDVFKERELMEIHGLNENDKYNLISMSFGGGSFDQRNGEIPEVANGMKRVFVKQIEGFSLFDWSLMFERAAKIHVVSSSNIYIMEMLDLQADEINIYLRTGRELNHTNYQYLMTRHVDKYKFH